MVNPLLIYTNSIKIIPNYHNNIIFRDNQGIYDNDTTIPDLIAYHETLTELFHNDELSDEDKKRAVGWQEKIISRCFENCYKEEFTQKQQNEFIQQLPQKEKESIEKQIAMYKQIKEFKKAIFQGI